MDIQEIVSDRVIELRALFVEAGYDMWLVGGACRDFLSGTKPKDIDLATSATPDEQIAIYEANGIHYIPTGLKHGTISVVLDEVYEITSLRTESEHDGRHATVAYTRDLVEDLSRRDLTINAMAMDFDGNIIDPYMGFYDLAAKRVRFVGNAEERMREDYLRILRFFRFHARFAGSSPIDSDAKAAIIKVAAGLKQISVERIWQEMSKIISGPAAVDVLAEMVDCGAWPWTTIADGDYNNTFVETFVDARVVGVTNPASLIGFMFGSNAEQVAIDWKFSTEERNRAVFISEEIRYTGSTAREISRWKQMLVDGISFDWVHDLMRWACAYVDDITAIENWVIPVMPVTGRDLIAAGVTPGPAMGDILDKIRKEWIKSDYQMDKEQLMKHFALCS